jgi:HEAT repeat protein
VRADSEQLDLFAWPRQAGAARSLPAAGLAVRSSTAVDVDALPTPALLRALERLLDGAIDLAGTSRRLIDEVARRRLIEAAPILVQLCRLHAGFDRARAVPEVTAALECLSALAAASAAGDILRLVEQDALGATARAAALRFFAAVRYRPAAGFARISLSDGDAAVRAGACALVAELGQTDALERLRELSADLDAGVAAAADLARGQLRDHAAKPVLEQRLRAASAGEMPRLVRALVGVADADTVVLLGRSAARVESSIRRTIVQALGEIDSSAAVVWLARFAGDEDPEVRVAAARALAEHDGPRAAAALRSLAADADPEVRETAGAIVRELDRPG